MAEVLLEIENVSVTMRLLGLDQANERSISHLMPEFPDRGGLASGEAGFRTTHWSVIMAARTQDGPVAQEALARLCSIYWYPLYAFLRRRGCSPHDAEDLTQEFFYRFLERDSLVHVNPTAGKFRSFLLACLKHFLVNEWERAHTQRRGGRQIIVPLE